MNQRIIYPTDDGGVAIIIPTGSIEDCIKDVPVGRPFEIVNASDIPTDRMFRGAWEQSGKAITHNLDKCKSIGHDMRRSARSAEFAPLDVEATIPSMTAKAEIERQVVRDKYATMQVAINAASTVDAIKVIIS